MFEIKEMSYNRSDAIDRCANLGKQFINHFIKVMNAGGIKDPDFIHHCDTEMAAWFNDVKEITLKPKSKLLSSDQLMDWFFTKGSSIDILLKDDNEKYQDIYSSFIAKLLADKNKKISIALIEAIKENK